MCRCDAEDVLTFLRDALEDEGYAVEAARDGTEALALAAVSRPDAILLDLRMPVLDGWGFLQAYRALPAPHAPVIVLTAQRVTKTAAELGADGLLRKPFALRDLFGLLETHLRPA